MTHGTSRPGFVFLISVLAVGTIALATVVSLLMLGGAAEKSTATLIDSMQAFENAYTCAERALSTLKSDLSYAGGETFVLTKGTCGVLPVGGYGNEDRILCVEGKVGGTNRRMELEIGKFFPRPEINSWNEVSAFTLCP